MSAEIRADALALPGARALFTTRRGGVSGGPYESLNLGLLTDDDPRNVSENRRRVAAAAGIDAGDVALAMQVHGTRILDWQGPAPGNAFGAPGAVELPRADGHVSDRPGLGLLVLAADCFPVALCDGRRAAMLHCGWRPLAAGILEQALERFERPPAAAVGPGIGGCCYEVGPEVLSAFAGLEGVADGRMLDLRAVIARKLANAGVEQVRHLDRCTSCEPQRYFSHRRDGGVTGRQAGLVVLDGR